MRSAYVHGTPLRELIHALKYGGWWRLGASLGRRLAHLEYPEEVTEEVRLVVPVPLSPARLRQRGYNQAQLLAAALCEARGWESAPQLLRRVRSAGSQTALHPSERRANVAGAFEAVAGAPIRGEHIMLVDDVWTTGATALACGEALLRGGARSYSVVTFARALPGLDR